MKPSELAGVLKRASITASLMDAGLAGSCERIEALEKELAARPTDWAYAQACKALAHWRSEAERLAKIAGTDPRQMTHD